MDNNFSFAARREAGFDSERPVRGEITMDVKQELGTLSEGSRGWSKMVKIISWNGGQDKIDIRDWNDETGKCGKGVSLTWDEMLKLYRIIQDLYDEYSRERTENQRKR